VWINYRVISGSFSTLIKKEYTPKSFGDAIDCHWYAASFLVLLFKDLTFLFMLSEVYLFNKNITLLWLWFLSRDNRYFSNLLIVYIFCCNCILAVYVIKFRFYSLIEWIWTEHISSWPDNCVSEKAFIKNDAYFLWYCVKNLYGCYKGSKYALVKLDAQGTEKKIVLLIECPTKAKYFCWKGSSRTGKICPTEQKSHLSKVQLSRVYCIVLLLEH